MRFQGWVELVGPLGPWDERRPYTKYDKYAAFHMNNAFLSAKEALGAPVFCGSRENRRKLFGVVVKYNESFVATDGAVFLTEFHVANLQNWITPEEEKEPWTMKDKLHWEAKRISRLIEMTVNASARLKIHLDLAFELKNTGIQNHIAPQANTSIREQMSN